jgi:hypothetical protein
MDVADGISTPAARAGGPGRSSRSKIEHGVLLNAFDGDKHLLPASYPSVNCP